MSFIYFLTFIFGLCVGSFLNALIFRLHNGGSIWRGRSKCPHCQKVLRWFELIPILSFIIQKGRCRSCHKKISCQYPLVELTTGVLFLIGLFLYPISYIQYPFINLLFYCFIVSVLLVIFVYDLKYGEIPDKIILPAIAIILFVQVLFWILDFGFVLDFGFWILNLVIGMAVGAGFFLLQYLISKGRWIGGGDIRLGVLMGVILGWPNVLVAIMLAYLIGAIFAVPLLIFKKKERGSRVPFGTFLTVATFITMFWGERMVEWYVGLLSF